MIEDDLKFGQVLVEGEQRLPAGSVHVGKAPFDGVPSLLFERAELCPSIGGDRFKLLQVRLLFQATVLSHPSRWLRGSGVKAQPS